MSLTKRRKEFLLEVKRVYDETREPVHYAALARALGVSKWTAYDMLKELEKQGYVKAEYVVNSCERVPGRSMVVFVPTKKAQAFMEMNSTPGAGKLDDWGHIKDTVLRLLDDLRRSGTGKAIDRLSEDLAKMELELPLMFCAHIIGMLVVCIKVVSVGDVGTIAKLLSMVQEPELGLTLLAGTVLGITALKATGNLDLARRLSPYLGRYQRYVSQISSEERKLLLDFAREALGAG
ncbi:MAG TPA: hypothetical protein GXX51_07035 [Firmicutes bacterium]|nr:hypothetical protein [Bacillota bacterium]